MSGKKTHEQQLRILERKPDVADTRRLEEEMRDPGAAPEQVRLAHPEARQSEFPVSRGGMNQEDRRHNKHNRPGQSGHKPQRHGPAEEGT